MGNSCGCGHSQFKVKNFQDKNKYKPKVDSAKQSQLQQILQQIAPSIFHTKNHINLAQYIRQHKQQTFTDTHFTDLSYPQKTSHQSSITTKPHKQHLHKLFNFQRMNISRLYSQLKTPYQSFLCGQIELSYLASVFYLICNHSALKEQIFITKYVNKYQCYVMRLFCNGQVTQVVVDDYVPTNKNQGIRFMNVVYGKELWPMLLEKGWCKQIGGYNKARGLSPEDCFQEITGVPAISHTFASSRNYVIQMLEEALKKQYWVALTAKIIGKETSQIKSRQVFYLESITKTMQQSQAPKNTSSSNNKKKHESQKFIIRSAYPIQSMNSSVRSMRSSRKFRLDNIQLQFGQILKYFEYYTIGYYTPKFASQTYQFRSNRYDDHMFELEIKNKYEMGDVPLNIRLIQFYEQYLSESDRQFYDYSPVLMELYDEEYKLVSESVYDGTHSTSLTKQAFTKLKRGKYYLRIQVSWINPNKICQANIVVYGPKNTQTQKYYILKQHDTSPDSQIKNNKLAGQIIAKSLLNSTTNILQSKNQHQQIKIKVLQRQVRYIIGIQNISSQTVQLKVILNGSENLKINHVQYRVEDMSLEFRLEAMMERVLELVPIDNKQPIFLGPFDIVKL